MNNETASDCKQPGEDELLARVRAWYRRTVPLMRTRVSNPDVNVVDDARLHIRVQSGTTDVLLDLNEEQHRAVQGTSSNLGKAQP